MSGTQLTWEGFDILSTRISNAIRERKYQIDAIVGIARGGMFLAGALSYKLEIKNVFLVNTQLYSNRQRVNPRILHAPKDIFFENILVVDDILDTGSTYYLIQEFVRTISNNAIWTVLIDKGKSNIQVDFIGERLHADFWIDFPWSR